MAKILVADDNSNIQKMVGLALKDQGIDVVAVGNGEAAVRKISDVRPDLVLADVFMPVRNGYEVCKYVKGDSSLSHIPVILLVGAFDPLDEEEAQRVGADGVLKKPFVPPDPLISMVKSALVRASTGQLNVPKPSNNEGSSATVTSLPGAETVAAMPTQAAPEPEAAEPVSSRPPDLKIEPGTQAPAFGSLLEAAPTETGDYTNYSTPNPALERNWSTNEEEEEDEEEEAGASWRPDGGNQGFGDEAEATAKKPEKKKREAWTPTREKKQDLLETGEEPDFVSQPIPAKPPATKPSVPAPVAAAPPSAPPVTPPVAVKPPAASAPPVTPPPAVAPATPVAVKPPAAAPKAPAPGTQPKPWVEMPPDKPVQPAAPPVQAAPTAPPKQAAPPPNQAATPAKPAAPKEPEKAAGDSWFSVTSTPWGTDPKHPGQGTPAWDAPTAAAAPPAKPPVQPSASTKAPQVPEIGVPDVPELEPEPEATGFYTESETLPELVSGGENVTPAMVEQLRQEATQVVEESAVQGLVESAPEYTLPAPEAPVPAPATAPDTDALVAKVLAKLNPEVLQAVTREILKPVVEAMVREEIKAKKP